MRGLDALLRCAWCDRRCRDRADLKAHHDEHRREEAEAEKTNPSQHQPTESAR